MFRIACFAVMLLSSPVAWGQIRPLNYEEDQIPPYTLPDPLLTAAGDKVTTADEWRNVRRPEILELFRTQMYGKAPGRPEKMTFQLTETDPQALGGKATRKQVTVLFDGRADGPRMDLLLYLPNDVPRPVPVFLGLNFFGNESILDDPGIHLTRSWVRQVTAQGVVDNRTTEKTRGTLAHRWPVEMILARGYGLVTACYCDIDPDFDNGFANGVHPLGYQPGQTRPADDQWASIAAWAWGLSRALDYLETDPDVDAKRVAVMGHSRLGKTAIWAGAEDQRFAIVISNNSGNCGAALSKRIYGETIARMLQGKPHWLCENAKQYIDHEERMPFDQHMLLALIAPRPLYVASAEDDRGADPRGEFLGAQGADPVYRLLGTDGLAAREMPGLSQPITSTIGYHIRPGKHEVTEYDWQCYLDFADKHFGRTAKRP